MRGTDTWCIGFTGFFKCIIIIFYSIFLPFGVTLRFSKT